jgi:orotate phosphoribosyltransferase
MADTNERLLSSLFSTKAIRVCSEDKPFWYTSGTIGPYYINTHFLYGSEEKANELLKVIDGVKGSFLECPKKVLKLTRKNYDEDVIYKRVIDDMCSFIKCNIDLNEVDCISGGERRDWFFSLLAAEMLLKPHITIYKDLTTVISENGHTRRIKDLNGKNVLHIADLITEASSYERAWIPAVKNLGGEIRWSVVVVDRNQGGRELLEANGIRSLAMIHIGNELFDRAIEMGFVNKRQHDMLLDFVKDPRKSMRSFLTKNPSFIEDALKSDEKTKERAKLCIEKDFYGLNR